MLIPGHATEEGTARYRARFASRLPGHFRRAQSLWLSSLGVGTYLGELGDVSDLHYRKSVTLAIEQGINVIDTAINYRHQRSERSVGAAIAELVAEGKIPRDEIFVATKGGFLSFDGSQPANAAAYFYDQVIRSGLASEQDVAAGCHVMTPKYLARQIETSRSNLGLETIDLYYVHNPETQLGCVGRAEFYRRLKSAFSALEEAVEAGKIRAYGTATWNAYRAGSEAKDHMDLNEVLRAAEEAAGSDHHFRAVQLPLNLAMPEALVSRTQTLNGRSVPFMQSAAARGLLVFASASLLQGQLASGLPENLAARFARLTTDAQRALQFVRSSPGVTSALVGMSTAAHVMENLATVATPPLTMEQYRALFASFATGSE